MNIQSQWLAMYKSYLLRRFCFLQQSGMQLLCLLHTLFILFIYLALQHVCKK